MCSHNLSEPLSFTVLMRAFTKMMMSTCEVGESWGTLTVTSPPSSRSHFGSPSIWPAQRHHTTAKPFEYPEHYLFVIPDHKSGKSRKRQGTRYFSHFAAASARCFRSPAVRLGTCMFEIGCEPAIES